MKFYINIYKHSYFSDIVKNSNNLEKVKLWYQIIVATPSVSNTIFFFFSFKFFYVYRIALDKLFNHVLLITKTYRIKDISLYMVLFYNYEIKKYIVLFQSTDKQIIHLRTEIIIKYYSNNVKDVFF